MFYNFLLYSRSEDEDELPDNEINKLLIVTQASSHMPARYSKHEGYDRTGDYTSRVKMSQDLEHAINDGLFYYEDELQSHGWIPNSGSYKTVNVITQEAFDKMASKSAQKSTNPDFPPRPPSSLVSFTTCRVVVATALFKTAYFIIEKKNFIPVPSFC